jgi:hypothetical protein
MIKSLVYLIKVVAIAVTAMLFGSCGPHIDGSGNRTTENRNAEASFDRIEVGQGIELVVTQSDKRSITVEADDNILPLIYTRIENGVLHIGSDQSYNTNESPKVSVTLPKIHGISSSSGSHASSTNTLITDRVEVTVESGAGADLQFEADDITIETSSGSDAKVSGKALKLAAASSSGSHLDASALESNDVSAEASSGSSVSVNPILSLTASASSGGSVGYAKAPKTLSREESSGGSVHEE